MNPVQIFFGVAALLLAALDGYQAITGKRLNKAPSRRTDEQMRRHSAVAAVLLALVGVAGIVLGLT